MCAESVLFLPGMMCDARLFTPQIEALDLPCSVVDMTAACSMPELAQKALDQAPPSFAVVGLSMGGILAFELWRRAPERISHLALIDTNPYADTPDKRSMRMDQVRRVLSGQLRSLTMESLKPAYLAKSNRDNKVLLDSILEMALDIGEAAFECQSVALRDRADSVATLTSISCPTVVICGAEDHICPVSYHEVMAAKIPDARLVVLENCGHLASLEQPAEVTRELQQLLRRKETS